MHDQITLKNAAVPRGDINPLSNVRRWRAATAHSNGRCPQDLKREAAAAWRRFVRYVRLLPPDEARMIWLSVSAEIEMLQMGHRRVTDAQISL